MLYHNGTQNFDGLEREVRATTKALREREGEFDCIVARGISGMCVAFPLSLRLRVPVLVVRKPDEDSHGSQLVGRQYLKEVGPRCVIVDDFVASGNTVRSIKKVIEAANGRIVGVFSYADSYRGQRGWDNTWNTPEQPDIEKGQPVMWPGITPVERSVAARWAAEITAELELGVKGKRELIGTSCECGAPYDYERGGYTCALR